MHLFKVLGLILAGAFLAFCAGAIFIVSLFEAPKLIAGWLPGAVAAKIGLKGVALFRANAPECDSGQGSAALQRILDRLQDGSGYGQRFKLHVVKGEHQNAIALPGRHIVLVSGLLQLANSPEEIAGVLAHEMGHGLEKDPEALFLRNIGIKVIVTFTTWAEESSVTFRAMLSQLRYSREAEIKADAHAVAILRRAGIAAKHAGEFILRSAAAGPAGESVISDLGAYPAPAERAALFLSQPPYDTEPVLAEEEWAAARDACSGRIATREPPIE